MSCKGKAKVWVGTQIMVKQVGSVRFIHSRHSTLDDEMIHLSHWMLPRS